MTGLESVLATYINVVEQALRYLSRYFRTVRLGPVSIELRTAAEREFGQTIEKIARAQENLTEAIAAIDDVKTKYTDEKTRLDELIAQVRIKRAEYERAAQDLVRTKELLAEDQERLRRLLGLNDRRSKIVGFISGVLASLTTAVIWFVLPWLWRLIAAAAATQ